MRLIALLALATVFLSGCDVVNSPEGDNSCSQKGQQAAISVVKDAVREMLRDRTDEVGNRVIQKGKARPALEQVKFAFQDVRAITEGTSSAKRFCNGDLKVTFPKKMIDDANAVNEIRGVPNVYNFIPGAGSDKNTNVFSLNIEFAVQPADDGQEVHATIADGSRAYNFIAMVVGGHLSRTEVERSHLAQQQAELAGAKVQVAPLNELEQAKFKDAEAQYEFAEQTIEAVWQAIPPRDRDRLQPVQRAWVKKKTADCRIESQSASTNPFERGVAKLECEARMTSERTEQLRRFVDTSDIHQF